MRSDLTPEDLARVARGHRADDGFLQAREFRAACRPARGRPRSSSTANSSHSPGQSELRAGRAVQARQCAVPQALGVVAVLDAGVGRAGAAVQCARLPELPPQGRARPSAVRAGQANAVSMFLRLSVPPRMPTSRRLVDGRERAASSAIRPMATQLQDFAVPGLKAEGEMVIDYADAAGDARRRHGGDAARSRPIRSPTSPMGRWPTT